MPSRFQKSEAVIDSSCLVCMMVLNREFPRYQLINALSLRYDKVYIPQHVWNEVGRKSRTRGSLKRLLSKHPFFRRCNVGSEHDAKLLYDRLTNPHARIDRGEAETIVQARDRGISEVLIDERKGTAMATAHNLSPRGIVGIIRELKRNDIIPEARPLFEACRKNRFWLSDALVQEVLEELEEGSR